MNKSFFARYYAYLLKEKLQIALAVFLIELNVNIFVFCFVFKHSIKDIFIGNIVGLVLLTVYVFIRVLILVCKNYSLYNILNEKGFCIEYLRAYEQKRITGKPFNMQYALDYAEIFMRIGQPAEAIKYLNTLTIPPNANVLFQAEYFYLYVLCALKIGNLAIAEDMWSKSGDMINKISANPKIFKGGGNLAIFAMICTDCFAARKNNDNARLERAFQQTENYLHYFQSSEITAFRIMLLYELRELGFTERYNTSLSEIRRDINDSKPLFNYVKVMQHENLDRIEKGGLPFLPIDK